MLPNDQILLHPTAIPEFVATHPSTAGAMAHVRIGARNVQIKNRDILMTQHTGIEKVAVLHMYEIHETLDG